MQGPDERTPKGSRSSGCFSHGAKTSHLISSLPHKLSTHIPPPTAPHPEVSGCLPISSKGPCFSSLKSSYLFTEHSPWLWHSGQSRKETVQQPGTQKELPCPESRSPAFPPLLSPLHRHPEDLAQSPTQNKHPPFPCPQVFKDNQCLSSFSRPTSRPKPGELFSPKKGVRLDLEPAARGVSC